MDALLIFLNFISYGSFIVTIAIGFNYFKGKFKKHHVIGMLVVLTFILMTINFMAMMYKTYFYGGH
jgi:hypothetical protein